MRQTLQEIGQNSLGQMLSLQDEQDHGPQQRCQCQGLASRVSRRSAKVLTVFGWLSYQRSYYRCVACQKRWFPLVQEHALSPGRATQGMARLLGIAGETVSFEEACRQISEYLRVQVSVNTLRKETQLLAKRQQLQEAEWIANSQDLDFLQDRVRHPKRLKRVYGSIDGAFVPIGTAWIEEITVSWYRSGRRYGSKELRAVDIHYYTSLEIAHAFGELLWATAVHHQADRTEALVFVCDGAAWIWKLVSCHFPPAIQIVDW